MIPVTYVIAMMPRHSDPIFHVDDNHNDRTDYLTLMHTHGVDTKLTIPSRNLNYGPLVLQHVTSCHHAMWYLWEGHDANTATVICAMPCLHVGYMYNVHACTLESTSFIVDNHNALIIGQLECLRSHGDYTVAVNTKLTLRFRTTIVPT